MKIIIGGASQGKLEYAQKAYDLREADWCDGRLCTREELLQSPYIYHLESFIKRELKEKHSMEFFAEELIKQNSKAIIITDEIGMGIVPMEESNRLYRELTGRICTKLCQFAIRVDRVFYGIGTVIKNVENTAE